MYSPSLGHLAATKRVLRYLKGTADHGIWYLKGEDLKLEGYVDSDSACCMDDMRSTSGHVFSLGSGPFSWNSKKQEVVAQSTAEAKYISAVAAAKQSIWLRKLLKDLANEQVEPTVIWCDNKYAIAIASNPIQHGRTKHIKVKFHFLREAEKSCEIKLLHCKSDEQLADVLTKALPKSKFEEMKKKLGVGGLGDVVTGLGKALQKRGHLVEIILPNYDCMQYDGIGNLSLSKQYILIVSFDLTGLPVYFIEPHHRDKFFWRGQFYGEHDDFKRFSFFSRAALDLLLEAGKKPDIIHCHDWQTAFVLNRPDRMQDNSAHDRVNPIKGAVVFSNIVTTVSPTDAQEVRTAEGGRGLHSTLNFHAKKFIGILNGIDTDTWNPVTDTLLKVQYSANNLQGKAENKIATRRHLGLSTADARQPLREFEGIASHFQNHEHVRLILKYDESLSHSIYAASDMFIIPSIFEPCGLTQMIAMRYGSIPIARKTGGLNDSVFDVDDDTIPLQFRNGYTFLNPDELGVNGTLERAFNYYRNNHEGWQQLVQKGMNIDFSWESTASQYGLYSKSVARSRAAASQSKAS
ncbi:hypothetical protein GH714_004872 [Hevea brasiliensis]|uniref:starch synthase n=1 Tax=Hevea brasiliensis TaxID=3981 RepID=A0A6A6LYC7_HEVBR|nr:hypothetical protein GH714_004872 [Hevea brasiliensis]